MLSDVSRKIISLDISLIAFNDLINKVIDFAKNRDEAFLCFANVHMVIEAYRNKGIQNAVNNSTFTVADGVPVQKALSLLYGLEQERIAGMDFMPAILREAEEHQIPVYFYGSTPEVLQLIANKINIELPALKVAGMRSPPFRSLSTIELEKDILEINESGARIVLVALGCPKQEKWMYEHHSKIKAVLLGVGGAFPVFAGTQKRAPKWLRNIGMEWSFRFVQEPFRLFKRYFVTNTLFSALLFMQLVKIRIFKKTNS